MSRYEAIVRHGLTDFDPSDVVFEFSSEVPSSVLRSERSFLPVRSGSLLSQLVNDAVVTYREKFGSAGWACVVSLRPV